MTEETEQELRDEIDRLVAENERLQAVLAQALDDMGDDGQGVRLETKSAMRVALGEEPT